ncbi:MAG: N-formylglutamate amidohydrolase [Pseudomonadota bacterium]
MVQRIFSKPAERRREIKRGRLMDAGTEAGTGAVSATVDHAPSFITGPTPQKPFEILTPTAPTSPVIFASPHSGRLYPRELLTATRLSRHALRQSEDCYVDLLFAAAPKLGAPLIKALFPRAYIDVNRREDELDPRMFTGPLAIRADAKSSRVLAGLGVLPRIVADGKNIYGRKISADDAARRLAACYQPYHGALRQLLQQTRARFGVAVLIDCHSMPTIGGAPIRPGEPALDFVIGDRFGTSAAPGITGLIETFLSQRDYHVARNTPYAGGHVAHAYGRPAKGVHVVQIEINRSLYLDEQKLTRTDGFDRIRALMTDMIADLVAIRPEALNTTLSGAWAAE